LVTRVADVLGVVDLVRLHRDEELIGARHPAIFSDAPQPLARFKIPAGFLLIPVGPLAS
jgi:hypothetical protein